MNLKELTDKVLNGRQITKEEALFLYGQPLLELCGSADEIRRRFGYHSIGRAIFLKDAALGGMNPREEHTIHPVGWRNTVEEGGS